MKLACAAYSYREELTGDRMSLEGFLETCRDLGLDGVELTQYYFPREDDAYLHYVKRRAFALGLDICATAVGGNFSHPDPERRQRQIAHVKDWLVKSSRLGSPCLRVFSGGQPEGVDVETARGWVVEGLDNCLKTAAECGVVLALENHGGLTSTARGVLDLLEPFEDSPWVGLNLDFGNFTGDVYEQFATCAPQVVTTHCKLSHRTGEEECQAVDYRKVVRLLRQAGYEGYLSIEYEGPEPAVSGVDRFAAYLRGCIEDA